MARNVSNAKYKFCLHKSYFDSGLGLTNYVKYLIGYFGLTSGNMGLTFTIAFAYAGFCYCLGWYWFNTDFVRAENEVMNQHDMFAQEVRQALLPRRSSGGRAKRKK